MRLLKAFLEKILPHKTVIILKEKIGRFLSRLMVKKENKNIETKIKNKYFNQKPRILFYHINGLSYGGTEKFLQILAKHLNKELFDVYFLFSPPIKNNFGISDFRTRENYLSGSGVNLIKFGYKSIEPKYPYFFHDAAPNIFAVLNKFNIDLLVTANPDYTEYPINLINDIPIVLLNIFGEANFQRNIVKHICVSHSVAKKAAQFIPKDKLEVIYNQAENIDFQSLKARPSFREQFNVPSDHIVFGRIGRADNTIFDPIGILAFEKVVSYMPWIHYFIMSPPPILVELVAQRNIPNVHFIAPSGQEEDIWRFYGSIDALAHFRKDGESCGLTIIEAMLAKKPIITHRSKQWNAHLEYLDGSFAFVADIDNVNQYAKFLEVLGEDRGKETILKIGQAARCKAEPLFLIENNINKFEKMIQNELNQHRNH